MHDIRIEWVDETDKPHTGVYGLLEDEATLRSANAMVDEPHLWFMARGGHVFGIPSKSVRSILAVRGG